MFWGRFGRRPADARSLAGAARASIGADACVGALARMFALFPDDAAIVVVDRQGTPIGVVTPDRLPRASGVVADVMVAIC